MYCRLIRRLQISFFLIIFLFCSAVSYAEETADAVKNSVETVKKHIDSVKNLINDIKGKTEIFKKQTDSVIQKKADVLNSLADMIQSQVEIVKSEAAKLIKDIEGTPAASINATTIKSWNETIEGFKKRASDYSLQADKLKQDVDELKKELVEPGYDTKYFFIHTGVVTLNPYKITKDPADNNKFKLNPAGESDTNVFLEALLRRRTAWLEKSYDYDAANASITLEHFIFPDDYEIKLGFYGFKESKGSPQTATVSGSGDASGEISIGWNIISPSTKNHPALDTKYTLNLELIYGAISNRAVLNIHNYYGLGIVSVWGIPFKTVNGIPRRLEILAGIYSKTIQVPEFVNEETREIKTKNEFPEFTYRHALGLKLDIHLPIGKNGFLTMAGQFNSITKSDELQDLKAGPSPITNPWSVSFGLTTPYDDLINKMIDFLKQ